jgi:uncharacterized protein (DUF58 family)
MSSRGRHPGRAFRPRLSMRGFAFVSAAAASLVLAYALDRRELLVLAFFLALMPALGALLLAVGRPRFSVTRTFEPEAVEAGRAVRVSLAVRNAGGAASPEARWFDTVPPEVGPTPSAELPVLGGSLLRAVAGTDDATELGYALQPEHRGVYPIGPFVVASQDPFGLVLRTVEVGAADPLVVTPRITPLPEVPFGRAVADGSAAELQRHGVMGDDDLITREYRPGDAKRRVHWRSTARFGELMVRQEEPRSNPEAVVFLDTRPRSYPHAHGIGVFDGTLRQADDFERAIELCASVALHLQGGGYEVDVLQSAARTGWLVRPREAFGAPGGSEEFLAGLAAVGSPGAVDRAFADRLSGELRRRGGGTPLFVVLGSPTADEAERLATLRPLADPAVAFLVTNDPEPDEESTLTGAGWTCVRVGTGDDLAAAWRRIGERTVHHEHV